MKKDFLLPSLGLNLACQESSAVTNQSTEEPTVYLTFIFWQSKLSFCEKLEIWLIGINKVLKEKYHMCENESERSLV